MHACIPLDVENIVVAFITQPMSSSSSSIIFIYLLLAYYCYTKFFIQSKQIAALGYTPKLYKMKIQEEYFINLIL